MSDRKRQVLWVDDDCPQGITSVADFEIRTARNCSEALGLLGGGEYEPESIVVDVIMPQGSWGEGFYHTPGIELVKHLRHQLGNRVRLAVYSVALNDERTRAAREAGANIVASKQDVGLIGVLNQLDTAHQRTNGEST